MLDTSRREFIFGLSALALFPLLEQTKPDLILYNGNFWTVDPQLPRAEAVAVSGGRFIAVGSNADVLRLAAGTSRKVDLGRKTVLPGFIDAHTHPAESGRLHLRQVDCDLRSITAIQEALRERAAKTPPDHWVLGFKYDDTKTSDGRRLTLQDLDAAVSDHPVLVTHRGGHEAFANSLALKLAKVEEKTPDPSGGQFERNSAGHLTGRINERAVDTFNKIIPSTYTRDDYREGVKLISKMMSKTASPRLATRWARLRTCRHIRTPATAATCSCGFTVSSVGLPLIA